MTTPAPAKPKLNWFFHLKRPKLPTPAQQEERKRILAAYIASRK